MVHSQRRQMSLLLQNRKGNYSGQFAAKEKHEVLSSSCFGQSYLDLRFTAGQVLNREFSRFLLGLDQDLHPLGAILLTNYTITKAPEVNRKHTFKAAKYGHRTYMFQAESEEDMNRWANAMSAAATANTKVRTLHKVQLLSAFSCSVEYFIG